MSEIIGIIGAGTMGNGIAQTAASNGFDVVMCDIQSDFVERGLQNIGKSLDRFVKKETITEENKNEILGRIKTTTESRRFKRLLFDRRSGDGKFRYKKTDFSKVG